MNTEYVKGECFFTRTSEITKQYNYLNKDIKTDVIIVGGGVTGAILGYYFSKNDINAVILEKGRIGHGSTSITTSLLQYELDSNAMELTEYTSKEKLEKSYKLGLKALDEISEFIKEHGNNCDYKKTNTLLYTAKNLEVHEMEQEYHFRKECGIDVEFIDENSSPFCFDLKAGVIGRCGGAVIDPYKFTHELIDVCINNGVEVYENTEVVKINYDNNGVEVETLYGHKVQGKIVICATGYNTGLFTDRTFGTKTTAFNIVTKPIEKLPYIYSDFVFRDNEDPYNYFRTTADNRIILGGEDINFLPDINNEKLCNESYDKLEQRLKMLFPNMDTKVEYRYCGCFESTQDNVGFIGKDPKNEKLWYNLGYGANGILFAILGGMMLSDLYKGKKNPDMDIFDVGRFDN